MRPCRYCATDPDTDSLEDAVQSLRTCNNCQADIDLYGQWTGKGMAAIVTLAKRFGRDAVIEAWEKACEGGENPCGN